MILVELVRGLNVKIFDSINRFEAQLLKWLSNPCPKENVPASSPPAAVVDGRKPRELFDVERVRPLETRLEKLQSQIRLAKYV